MNADPRHLPWDACLNVRDLGGFTTRDGHQTRWRTLVRADNLCRLTWHGRTALVRYGIKTVIDLRFPSELALEHDPFSRPELDQVRRLKLPLLSEAFRTSWNHRMTGHESDLLTLATCRANFAAVIQAVADAPEGGVLFYCHAGKDRTGQVAAVLLALLGVDHELINADHVASDRYLEPLYEAWIGQADDPAVRARGASHLRLDPAQMRQTLAALNDAYGGAESYLLASGVTPGSIGRVRRRLLE